MKCGATFGATCTVILCVLMPFVAIWKSGQPQELQHDRGAHKFARILLKWRNFDCGFLLDFSAVGTRKQALLIECADLALQGASAPTLVGGFIHVPQARFRIFGPQKCAVVSPAQFATQCVANWESQIKTAHVP